MSGPDSVTAAPTAESPYVGLTHYTEEYSDRFFGRDAQIAVIIGNLRAARLTLLYAESGVGKSSLLRAGVAARLRRLADRDAETRGSPRLLPVVFSSWTDQPVAALVDAIEDAIRPYLVEGDSEIELPRDRLDEAIEVANQAIDATLLVILDQFEEYFLYRSQGEGEDGFADQLTQCVNDPDLRANFLISIREDAYAGLGDLFRGRIANVYGNFLHLEYLDGDEAREAITRPIERMNELHPEAEHYEIEPALVDAVLDQVRRGRFAGGENGHGPTGAPAVADGEGEIETTYLQLVMKRLWDEETAAGSRRLRLETLNRLGGAQKIIGTHLDRSMRALSPKGQAAAASLFRFLVTRAGTKVALTAKDLSELSQVPEAKADPVLRRLAAGDLHILRPVAPRDGHGEVSYEIFHDALARPIVEWRTRKDKEELAARVERERAAKEAAQREASEAEQRESRERGRKRLALTGVVVLGLAILVLAGVVAIVQGNLADERKQNSQSIQAAERIAALGGSPILGQSAQALASLEAYRLWPTFAARNQTLGVLHWNAGLPRIAAGHTRSAWTVSFWPGSSRLASGGSDGTVRLWDADGRQLVSLLATNGRVNGVAVSPAFADGRRILAAALDSGRIRLWDVTHPQHPRLLEVLEASTRGGERTVVFNPKQPWMLAAAGGDGVIRLWDLRHRNDPHVLGTHKGGGWVGDLAFATNGAALYSAGAGGKLRWRIRDTGFTRGAPTSLGDTGYSTFVAVATNGSYAFSVSDGIELYDATRDKRLFLPTTDDVYSLAFADRGSTLVSAGADLSITTWDVESGRPFGPPRTHGSDNAVLDLAVSDDGATIASGGEDNNVKLWPLESADSLATTVGGVSATEGKEQPPSIWQLAFGASGYVAAASDAAGAFIWRLDGSVGAQDAAEPVTRIPASGADPSYAVAYRGDILAASEGSSFRLWDTGPSCQRMPERPCLVGRPSDSRAHSDSISRLAFGRSDGADLLASSDYKGNLSLWAAVPENGEVERLWEAPRQPEEVNELAFSPTDPLLAAAGEDGTVRIWDVSDPRDPSPVGEPLVAPDQQPVYTLAFSPDGSLLASGGADQQVVFSEVSWEEDGPAVEPIASTLYQSDSILGLGFSRDGETLAVGDGAGALCLYDVASRRSIGDCAQVHYGPVSGSIDAVAFVPDGTAVLTAGRGNPIVSWDELLWNQDEDAETVDALTAQVCELAGRNLTQDEWDQVFVDTEFEGERHQTCEQYPLP